MLSQPELLVEQVKNRSLVDDTAYLGKSLDRVSHALEKKVVEANRMLDAYKVGVLALQTLKEKMDGMRKERAELGEEKSRLERELSEAKA